MRLSGENKRQFWVPEGFAHGYCVLSDEALFTYKCSDFYQPENELSVLWNDPGIGIACIIRYPAGNVAGGRDHDTLLSNVDYLPTILELAGLDVPDHVQGLSFSRGDGFAADAQPGVDVGAVLDEHRDNLLDNDRGHGKADASIGPYR